MQRFMFSLWDGRSASAGRRCSGPAEIATTCDVGQVQNRRQTRWEVNGCIGCRDQMNTCSRVTNQNAPAGASRQKNDLQGGENTNVWMELMRLWTPASET